MSRITKEIASEMAKKLTSKKTEEINALENELQTKLQEFILKKIPKELLDLFKKHPNYFNKTSSFNIDKVLFVIGNDVLHIDNPKRTTTSGTPQDTDGMWHSNFLIAKQLYIDIIEKLICVADVHVVFNPSNHDYTNGFFLAQVIETHFKNCKNVTFDCSISHRKYFVYGQNLIGTTHGDGAKTNELPLLMANESKDWSNCKHRYIYIHHYHHKIAKDYTSVCVEALRSPSGTDSWHHRNGYEHAPKAVEGFIHSKEHGQIARITNLF